MLRAQISSRGRSMAGKIWNFAVNRRGSAVQKFSLAAGAIAFSAIFATHFLASWSKANQATLSTLQPTHGAHSTRVIRPGTDEVDFGPTGAIVRSVTLDPCTGKAK
jgi:hypothetical protein